MHSRAPAIVVSVRPHGETAVIARLLTESDGLIAAYIAGGRGRAMRPVAIPGNLVDLQLSSRSDSQLPFGRLELTESRGQFMTEPLAAAAIGWVCALTATAMPERHSYPSLYQALHGLLSAICNAASARGWVGALVGYEMLLLREMGYGGGARPEGELPQMLEAMDALAAPLDHYLLADKRGDVMGARLRLREMLGRIV